VDLSSSRGGRARRRWLALTLLTAWAVALVGAGIWSAANDPATVREQSDLAQGRRTLDGAVEAVVAAAGPGVTPEIGGHLVTTGCRLSLVRSGTAVERVVVLRVPGGQEQALLDKLADRLPRRWETRHGPGSGDLYADAGDFVRVDGEVTGEGEVRMTASTGCRAGADPELSGAGGQ
jgi:hypothetical protein